MDLSQYRLRNDNIFLPEHNDIKYPNNSKFRKEIFFRPFVHLTKSAPVIKIIVIFFYKM
jgi:hypothetical protein